MPRYKKGIKRHYKPSRRRQSLSNVTPVTANTSDNDLRILHETNEVNSLEEMSSDRNNVNTVDSSRGRCSTNLNENFNHVNDRSRCGGFLTNHNVNDNLDTAEFLPNNSQVLSTTTSPQDRPSSSGMLDGVSVGTFNTSIDSNERSDVNDSNTLSNLNVSIDDAANTNSNLISDPLSESEEFDNNQIPKNDSPFSSYAVRRRHVRHIKKYIKSLNNYDQKVAIVSDLFNDYEILPLLRAGGMVPPNEAIANKKLLDQFSKQVNRSSLKDSSRGRINDDLQSYRINAVGLLMNSPSNNADEFQFNKDVFRLLRSNTNIPKTSARRLMDKANRQRQKLTAHEKCSAWSIITHRKTYNTKQNILNASLFDWILNHTHVRASPIYKDTVLVKVPSPDGTIRKERVGKLLLEISVRALHQDMMKDPPPWV